MVVEMLVTEVINMKNTIIQEIEQSLLNYLDNSQLDALHTVLCRCLDKVEIKVLEEEKRSFYSILSPRVVKVELTLKEDKKEKNKVILCNMHKKQDDNMLKYTY